MPEVIHAHVLTTTNTAPRTNKRDYVDQRLTLFLGGMRPNLVILICAVSLLPGKTVQVLDSFVAAVWVPLDVIEQVTRVGLSEQIETAILANREDEFTFGYGRSVCLSVDAC